MKQVLVCQYVNCSANGSQAVLQAFQSQVISEAEAIACDCQGQCNMGPTVRILPDDTPNDTWYCRIKPEDVPEIIDQHLHQGKPVDRLLHPRMHPQS